MIQWYTANGDFSSDDLANSSLDIFCVPANLVMPEMTDKMLLLRIFGNRSDAEELRMLLEGSGIKSKVLGDDAGGVNPVLAGAFGVKVLVSARDYDEARLLVDSAYDGRETADSTRTDPQFPKLFFSVKAVWWVVLANLCLAFGSKYVFGRALGEMGLNIFLILFGGATILTLTYAIRKMRLK